jgi:hypothetical protein
LRPLGQESLRSYDVVLWANRAMYKITVE